MGGRYNQGNEDGDRFMAQVRFSLSSVGLGVSIGGFKAVRGVLQFRGQ